MKNLKTSYAILSNEYDLYKIHQSEDKSCVYYYCQLLLGIFSTIFSLIWITHIVLYFLIPSKTKVEFLNIILIYFVENNLTFISIGIFSILCIYLLMCVIKGSIKFNFRFFCFDLHPLIKNETYLNSFIFNVNLVLISSISIIQFSVTAFDKFTLMTDISIIFLLLIRYLQLFKIFFDYFIFEYILISFALIFLIMIIFKPNDKEIIDMRIANIEKNDKLLENEK